MASWSVYVTNEGDTTLRSTSSCPVRMHVRVFGFSCFLSEAVCLNVMKSPNVEIPVTNAKLFQLNSLSLGVLNLTMRRLSTPLAPWATGVFFLALCLFQRRISRWFCAAPPNGRSESCHF